MSPARKRPRVVARPETAVMNRGYDPQLSEGAIKSPIFMTSTFVFPGIRGEVKIRIDTGHSSNSGRRHLLASVLRIATQQHVRYRTFLRRQSIEFWIGQLCLSVTLLSERF